jgi:hypothetical protein
MMNEVELGDFYRRIGAALCHLQYFEDVLVTFLTMKIIHEHRCAGRTVTIRDAQTLLADKRRMLTLGPLVDSCISKKIIRPEHQGRIKAFKGERDWLVHRSMVENGDDLYVSAARDAVFSRITAIQEEAISLKKVTLTDFEGWAAAHCVDVSAAQSQAKEAVRNLNHQS